MARSQELARLFQQPVSPAHRRYEICRPNFHESTHAGEIAKRFHFHVGSVRAVVRDVARDPDVNSLFATAKPGRKTCPKRNSIHEQARSLRREGATLADIQAALQGEGIDISEPHLFRLLTTERIQPDRSGQVVSEVRRRSWRNRDHGEKGHRSPEQTSLQSPPEGAVGNHLVLPAIVSPNLNPIERPCKFIKRGSLYGRYHPTFAQFQSAIQDDVDDPSTLAPKR